MSAPLAVIRSKTVVLPVDNVDTDQIIPARFLVTVTSQGMGRGLFADWRYEADGREKPDFALNRPEAAGARVLVTGRNFGCGSSREHAVWALAGAGFQAVVSPSFADIFKNNALKNGLLPVVVDAETHGALLAHPGAEVTIDVGERTLQLAERPPVTFPLDPFARFCLLNGVDELQFLLSRKGAIAAHESAGGPLPWRLS